MKVTLRRVDKGIEAYVPKKDLEEMVVEVEKPELWGGTITLANGWRFQLPEMAADTPMPITVDARKLGGED
jgi:nitrogen fixation protein NifT